MKNLKQPKYEPLPSPMQKVWMNSVIKSKQSKPDNWVMWVLVMVIIMAVIVGMDWLGWISVSKHG